jgi:hypothetical protein
MGSACDQPRVVSVPEPQPKSKQTCHHEDREEHEVRKHKKNESFVVFVRFVVTWYFLVDSAIWKQHKKLRKLRNSQ